MWLLYYRCILGGLTTSSVLSIWRLLSLKRLHDLQHNSVVKIRRTGNFRDIGSYINIQCIPLSLMTTSLFLVSLVPLHTLLLFTESPLLIFMFLQSVIPGAKGSDTFCSQGKIPLLSLGPHLWLQRFSSLEFCLYCVRI